MTVTPSFFHQILTSMPFSDDPKVIEVRPCQVCGNLMKVTNPKKLVCSDACKQKKYRFKRMCKTLFDNTA